MKKIHTFKYKSLTYGFTILELLVVIAIIGLITAVILANVTNARGKARDSKRLSDIRQISYALELYRNATGYYPACLIAGGSCGTKFLEGVAMPKIPTDPLTGIAYTYAAIGSGTNCTSYHIGASLEDMNNKAMLTGADSAPRTPTCTGSAVDFSGLAKSAGGQQCSGLAGTAQPGGTETCYDLAN